jgi:hypothetical protein
MSLHALTNGERRRPAARVATRSGLLQLGWPHFWLLTAILGLGLSLMVLIFFALLSIA